MIPLTIGMTTDTEPPVPGPLTVRFRFSEPVTGFSRNDIETGQDSVRTDDRKIRCSGTRASGSWR